MEREQAATKADALPGGAKLVVVKGGVMHVVMHDREWTLCKMKWTRPVADGERGKLCSRCKREYGHVMGLVNFVQDRIKGHAPGPWFVGEVTRDDAGGKLYAPVRYENGGSVSNTPIEHGVSPSHDRAAVQRFVDDLNRGVS